MKSLKRNTFYSVMRSLLITLVPLIIYPYASRVLGVQNIGKVSFAESTIKYFTLFATFGVTTYAVREGVYLRSDRQKFSQYASELFSFNMVTTVIAYLVLFFLLRYCKSYYPYKLLLIIASINIILTTIGTEWINVVYEDYAYIMVRTLIVQLIVLISIFIFIRKSSDYIAYAIISLISSTGANVINFIHIRRYCSLKLTIHINLKKHLKPLSIIFLSMLAITVYVNADITMLGLMENDYEVGLYSTSTKIYTAIKTLLMAGFGALSPRLYNLTIDGISSKYIKLFNNILNIFCIVLIPCSLGIVMLSKEIISLFSGSAYLEAHLSLSILGVSTFFTVISGILSSGYFLPLHKEKIILYISIVSAATNILLNLFFIPYFKCTGAAITTLISEIIVVFFEYIYISVHGGKLIFKISTNNLLCIIIISLEIILTCRVFSIINNIYIYTFLIILINVFSYIIIVYLYNKNLFHLLVKKRR